MLCNTWARALGYLSWTNAHSVINSDKEMNKVSKCLEKCVKHDDCENLAIICCKMPKHAKNARACAFEWFCVKCSIWLETYAKKNWDDLEHFKFLRARKRADQTRTRAFAHVFWPEIDRTDIDLIHNKYEWEITFRYKDMIISWFSQNGAWMTSRWCWVYEKSRSSKLD